MRYRLLLFPLLVFPLMSCSDVSTPTEPPPASEFAGRWWVTLTVYGSLESGVVPAEDPDDPWAWDYEHLSCSTDHRGLISYIEFPEQDLTIDDYRLSMGDCGELADTPVVQVVGWDQSGEDVSWLDIQIGWKHVMLTVRANKQADAQYSVERTDLSESLGTVTLHGGTLGDWVYALDGYAFTMKKLDLQ